MTKKKYSIIFNIMLFFVLLQPVFDIFSNLYIEGILKIGISTYIKPLFVGLITLILFVKYNKNKKIWILYMFLFLGYILGHYLILKNLFIDTSIINQEIRFIINIIYMVLLFFDFYMLYKLSYDKKNYLIKIKKTISITFLIYSILLIISVLTNTSGLTYEYADKTKLGFKGWYDSGQILGHTISIMFPILLYTLLKPRYKWYYRVLFILPIIIVVSLLGTKVPYFIVIIVLFLYLIISIYNKIFNKFYKLNIFNLVFVLICLFSMLFTYKYTPVHHNINVNNESATTSIESYKKEEINASSTIKYYDNLIKLNNDKNITNLKQYRNWVSSANKKLLFLYDNGKLHPSDIRNKQLAYSIELFKESSLKYKLFGVGYLNHFDGLSIERDFFMAFLSFGALGFVFFLFVPILEFIKATIYMLKNRKTNDLETYLLYASFGIFFCISIYAGYTYIYTNFSVFLVLLVMMLKCKIDINEDYKRERLDVKKITFLMLHLGIGGIETSTINTANALCKKYDIELVSLYNLKNNQLNKINKNIKVKFLYNGEPNKEEFNAFLKDKKYFKVLKEGIKSLYILIIKKLFIIKAILNCKSDVIVSTRVEFSVLLSKFGARKKIKIAQEHHHHNDNKKYIGNLSYRYNNINYLFALTKTLEQDYRNFLKYNRETEIILMPNMIKSKFDKITDLKENNLIFVGRMHECKKVDDLINIFYKLNIDDSKLFIIGDGEKFNDIKNLVNDLKLQKKVELLGFLDQNKISKYLVKSKLFCMTSTTEGLPMVLLEAMSHGVPCIAYETKSGVKDVIDNNENGFIIYNRNEDEYINKIKSLINNKKLLKNMSKNALAKAKSFSEKEIVKSWVNILSKNQEV